MPDFTFSTSIGDPPLVHPIDFGTASNTGGTSVIPIYVSHDAGVDLQNTGVYIQPFTGTSYVGLFGQSQDYLDFLDWGTNADKGLIANMDAQSTSGAFDNQFKSGGTSQGAAATNAIPFSTAMFGAAVSTAPGHFPVGETGHMTLKIAVPSSESNTALRMASIFLKFDQ